MGWMMLYLQQRAHSHLNGTGDIVRIMFFDFSSAFNTCAQDGRHHFYSEQVPSAFLFTSTTVKRAACTSYPMTLQCLGDDSQDLEYREPLRNFVERSGRNHLNRNSARQKRRWSTSGGKKQWLGPPTSVDRWAFTWMTDWAGRQQWCCVQEGDSALMILWCVQHNAGDLWSVCWGQHQCQRRSRINKLMCKAGSVIGQNVKAFESVRVKGHWTNRSPSWTTHHAAPLHSREAAELVSLRLI